VADLGVPMARLSPAARTVCGYLADGQSINQIAGRMGTSWHTIVKHVAAIRQCFTELGLGDLAEDAQTTAG
jgi:DNA-binding CsgD family transcriptional regulator